MPRTRYRITAGKRGVLGLALRGMLARAVHGPAGTERLTVVATLDDVTVRVKLSDAVRLPSLTLTVTVAAPDRLAAGVTLTVRLEAQAFPPISHPVA